MKNLYTERLILRPWKEDDSKDLYEYAKSDLVGPNAGWPIHESEEKSKKIIQMFIKNNDTYAIELKSKKKVIGSIGLHNKKSDKTLEHLNQKEIGYVLNPKVWGHGFVPEAVMELLNHGFNELNLDLIWCGHFDFNDRSKRVIEKCGFTFRFSRKEKLVLLDNKEVTELYYNIFKEDFISKKGDRINK